MAKAKTKSRKDPMLHMQFSGLKNLQPGIHTATIDEVTTDPNGNLTAHVHVVEPPHVEQIRTFADDWRVANPKLHNLYVREAYTDLTQAQEAARALEDRQRVPCNSMAVALRQAMREEIERSAAYFEAAALLFAGLEPPKGEVE